VELDLARAQVGTGLLQTLKQTVRNTVIHPVVLPVVAGLAWNAVGLPLPAVLDEVLQMLGTAVVPLCLVLIGMSLAYYGWPSRWRGAVSLALLKLFALPTLVLLLAHWGLGLSGQPLAVIVMMAALPVGSNALIFAQRYQTREAETTAAIVISTLLFALTAPLWLAVLSRVG
jgi:predicted permease